MTRPMILVAVAGLVAAFLAMGLESNRRLEVADRHFLRWLALGRVESEWMIRGPVI